MKPRVVTETAARHIASITRYIHRHNPAAARNYRAAVSEWLDRLDEFSIPKRATERLPDHVREAQVPGFRGYVVRVAFTSEAIVLLAAFAPHLSDRRRDAQTRTGLRELD